MLRVFNCGIGMTLVSNKNDAKLIINELKNLKINSKVIGNIISKKGNPKVSYLNI